MFAAKVWYQLQMTQFSVQICLIAYIPDTLQLNVHRVRVMIGQRSVDLLFVIGFSVILKVYQPFSVAVATILPTRTMCYYNFSNSSLSQNKHHHLCVLYRNSTRIFGKCECKSYNVCRVNFHSLSSTTKIFIH